MTSVSAFNFKHRIGLLALGALMVLRRICSADAQTDEDFTPGTLSRLCSRNALIPCITSDCSWERSISGVIRNFAVVALSSWVASAKRSSFGNLLLLCLCFVSCICGLGVITMKDWQSGVKRFPGQRTWRRGLAELHYLTSCKPTRALHQADSTVNNPASMLVFSDLCCD